ncbi:hypothetical protein BDY21DRAFT_294880 [Lineolata rhizophorae]|uniref:Cupredoxin n=1 Tax=Lineolata rhizophorae TaxID=578093 RepID=A0A6A6NKU1_9PEZI|nr:hypothetical protein BDY21DRAFT_294880 [Lineolata rhizophorae]
MIPPRLAPPVNVHTVKVGSGGNFKYDPDTIFTSIGDVVMFKFYPSNHSVVRGEYTGSSACGGTGCNPRVPYELIHLAGQGFHSENDLTFSIVINDTSPIWFYCSALQFCHSNGMVGVINPANGTSVDIQRQAAQTASFQFFPGEPWPVEGSTASGSTLKPSAHHLSGGVIARVVIGVIVFIGMIAAALYFVLRSRVNKQEPDPADQKSVHSFTKDESEDLGIRAYSSPRPPPAPPATDQPDLVSPTSPQQDRFQMQERPQMQERFELDGRNLISGRFRR